MLLESPCDKPHCREKKVKYHCYLEGTLHFKLYYHK